jgi:hypothetical protein
MKVPNRRTKKSGLILILTAIIVAMSFGISAAQDVANTVAQGTVVPLLVVTGVQALNFGTIYQGVPDTILRTDDANAAIFGITGQAGAGINLQLILPEYLSLTDGSDRMPIMFGPTDAAIDADGLLPSTVVGSAISFVNENPYILNPAAVIGAGGDGCRVYLGGQVNPSTNQAAGTYVGDLILMVAYNNN